MNVYQKANEIFSDQEFVQSLTEFKTREEAQSALAEKGLELTEKDFKEIKELLEKVENNEISPEQLENMKQTTESGELGEESLENVSGGILAEVSIGTAVAILVACGVVGGGAGAGATYGIYKLFKWLCD